MKITHIKVNEPIQLYNDELTIYFNNEFMTNLSFYLAKHIECNSLNHLKKKDKTYTIIYIGTESNIETLLNTLERFKNLALTNCEKARKDYRVKTVNIKSLGIIITFLNYHRKVDRTTFDKEFYKSYLEELKKQFPQPSIEYCNKYFKEIQEYIRDNLPKILGRE